MGSIKRNGYISSFVSVKTTYTLRCNCGAAIEITDFKDLPKNDMGEFQWTWESDSFPATAESIINVRCPACEKKHIEKMFASPNIRNRIQADYYKNSQKGL